MKPKSLKHVNKYLATTHKRIKNIPRKKIIMRFAGRVGLIYFGVVNQHSDEHTIIRGLTVSPTHRDNHFCVGTVNGYDVSMVDRVDIKLAPDGSTISDNWLVFAIELRSKTSVPHFLIDAKNSDTHLQHLLSSTYPNMKEVDLEAFEPYDAEFVSRFSVFTLPAMTQEIHDIIMAKTAKVLGAHFWPLSIEQNKNILYIYSTQEKITPSLLSSMLENGLWLAAQIDLSTDTVD